jgi:hypothetical protein
MNVLEERYRALLRLLPATYRKRWEDDMVDTFLETTATDDPEDTEFAAAYGRPGWPEVTSIVGLALRLRFNAVKFRLGDTGAPPRHVAWGEAVRLAALVGLLTYAASTLVGLGTTVWVAGVLPWLPAPPPEWTLQMFFWSPWHVVSLVVGVLFVAAYLALVIGRARVARTLAIIAVAASTLRTIWETGRALAEGGGVSLSAWVGVGLDVLLLVALLAFHDDFPPVRRRYWFAALPLAVALFAAPMTSLDPPDAASMIMSWPGMSCVLLVAATIVHLAGRARGWAIASPAWSLALALLAAAVFAVQIAFLVEYALYLGPFRYGVPTILVGLGQAAAVLAAGLVLRRHALRTLPPMPEPPGAKAGGHQSVSEGGAAPQPTAG